MSTQQHLQLAKSLPPRLVRFFQRFPPPALFPKDSAPIAPAATAITSTTTSTPTETTQTVTATTETPLLRDTATPSYAPAGETSELGYHNPFLPRKNFRTGKWIGPVYGLRKQADLVKLAQKYGVLDLLPYTVKKPGEKEKRRIERGLQVKGTGEGQKVKGHIWERTLKGRLEMRRQAMINMPALIQEWKQVCAVLEKVWGSLEANEWNRKVTVVDGRSGPVAKRNKGSVLDVWRWLASVVAGFLHRSFWPMERGCCVHSGLYGHGNDEKEAFWHGVGGSAYNQNGHLYQYQWDRLSFFHALSTESLQCGMGIAV